MEPMTLGSPGSPSTSTIHSSFLPGYLMGEQSPHLSKIPGSPTKTARQISYSQNISTTSQGVINSPVPERKTRPSNMKSSENTPAVKCSGPPLVSLFDTLQTTTVPSPKPNAQVITPNNDYEPDCWVTVFGFPAAATQRVVTYFNQLGPVVENYYTGRGNWINLCFNCKLTAQRALALNGRILDGSLMIGVIPFKEHHALKDLTNVDAACISSPKSPRPISRRLNTSSSSPYITTPPSRMRPLVGRSPENIDVVGPHNIPVKNTSFVSKTIDYFFG